jgi:hypothetical protein
MVTKWNLYRVSNGQLFGESFEGNVNLSLNDARLLTSSIFGKYGISFEYKDVKIEKVSDDLFSVNFRGDNYELRKVSE